MVAQHFTCAGTRKFHTCHVAFSLPSDPPSATCSSGVQRWQHSSCSPARPTVKAAQRRQTLHAYGGLNWPKEAGQPSANLPTKQHQLPPFSSTRPHQQFRTLDPCHVLIRGCANSRFLPDAPRESLLLRHHTAQAFHQ